MAENHDDKHWGYTAPPAKNSQGKHQDKRTPQYNRRETVERQTRDGRETDADPRPARRRQPHTLISEVDKLERNKKIKGTLGGFDVPFFSIFFVVGTRAGVEPRLLG